jgi:FtsZ-binding cell division protein ZapB
MNEIKRLKEENNMLKQRVEDLGISLSDEIALEKRIQEHMALLVVLFAEIESLRSRIADKEKEI